MKILLNECIDWRLSREIIGHEVRSARQMGWTEIKNGQLLTLAAQQFDAFVTVDQNLPYQQNAESFAIAILILRAKTNRLAELKLLVPELLKALPLTTPGTATLVPAS